MIIYTSGRIAKDRRLNLVAYLDFDGGMEGGANQWLMCTTRLTITNNLLFVEGGIGIVEPVVV